MSNGIASGHPIGALGAGVLVKDLQEMGRRYAKKRSAPLRVGWDAGVAMCLER